MNFSTLYATLDSEGRADLAKKLETDAGYLWQLATRWRGKRPSFAFMEKLAAADPRMTLGELVDEYAANDAGKQAA
jgi:hypothetical protein